MWKRMKRHAGWISMAAFAAAALMQSSASAAPDTQPAASDGMEAVREALQPLDERWSGFDRASYTVRFVTDISGGGESMQSESVSDFAFERPNKLSIRPRGSEGMLPTIVSDGESLYIEPPMGEGEYIKQAAPETLDAEALSESLGLILRGFGPLAIEFVAESPSKAILYGVSSAEVVEAEEGKKAVQIMAEGTPLLLTFEAGEAPLPTRATVDMESLLAQAPAGQIPEDAKMDIHVDYADWKFGEDVNADFTYAPPEGGKEFGSLEELMMSAMQQEQEEHALLGDEAIPFELKTLDGKTVNSDDLIGEKVVMLDFWATWCGPCVAALPAYTKLYEELKDQDFMFYAVDLREDEETVKSFLEDLGISPPVLMDTEGELGTDYQAEGIPQTVLIGKDGKIHSVHVGYRAGVENQLKEEINTLLEGGSLLEE